MGKENGATVDWKRIEEEYRSGVYSNVALAQRWGITEGAIRHRAKKEGWVKQHQNEVRKATRAKLAEQAAKEAGHGATRAGYDKKAVIESAADECVKVVLGHRRDLKKLVDLINHLQSELETMNTRSEDLEALIEDALDEIKDARVRNKREHALNKALSISGRAATAKMLVEAMDRLVKLQRKAYAMDDQDGEEPDYEKQLRELKKQQREAKNVH